jgi:hypothetical protein
MSKNPTSSDPMVDYVADMAGQLAKIAVEHGLVTSAVYLLRAQVAAEAGAGSEAHPADLLAAAYKQSAA